jgi:hypothetical protein
MASTLMAAEGLILTKVHGDWKSDSVHTKYVHRAVGGCMVDTIANTNCRIDGSTFVPTAGT